MSGVRGANSHSQRRASCPLEACMAKAAASAKAHVREAFPIFVPAGPLRWPADALAHARWRLMRRPTGTGWIRLEGGHKRPAPMLLCSTADIDSLAMAGQLQFVSHKKIIASRLHCLYPGPHLEELSYGATGGFNRPHRCVERRGGTHFAEKETWEPRTDATVPRVSIAAGLSNFS